MSPPRTSTDPALPARPLGRALARGARLTCPACGEGRVFRAYLKVADRCERCGEELQHHRADDAPAYLVIFAVGHLVVPATVLVEQYAPPPLWVYAVTVLPLTILLCLLLLPPIKGAVVALQWALRMHGFSGTADPGDPIEAKPQ